MICQDLFRNKAWKTVCDMLCEKIVLLSLRMRLLLVERVTCYDQIFPLPSPGAVSSAIAKKIGRTLTGVVLLKKMTFGHH